MNKKLACGLLVLLTPAISFAKFCPTNFNQINVGDTIEQVTQKCGKPDKQETKTAEALVPQEWNYYIPQSFTQGAQDAMEGTLKTTFAFDDKGNAININVNGIGVGATSICGSNVKLGDSQETIKAACGAASFISKQETPPTPGQPAAPKITTFTYSTHVTQPAVLSFTDGKLTE